jgi:hypothetical protein
MEAYKLYITGFNYQHCGADNALLKELDQNYVQQSDVDLILDEYLSPPINDDDVYDISNLDLVTALQNRFPQFSKRLNVPTIGKKMVERGYEKVRRGKKKVSCYKISKTSMIKNWIDHGI